MKNKTANTYSLLINSEEKERSIFENAIYMLLIGSACFSIWQAAHQPITLPTAAMQQSTAIAQTAQPQQPGV